MKKESNDSKIIDYVSYCRESQWKRKVSQVFKGIISWGQYYRWCREVYGTLTIQERVSYLDMRERARD